MFADMAQHDKLSTNIRIMAAYKAFEYSMNVKGATPQQQIGHLDLFERLYESAIATDDIATTDSWEYNKSQANYLRAVVYGQYARKLGESMGSEKGNSDLIDICLQSYSAASSCFEKHVEGLTISPPSDGTLMRLKSMRRDIEDVLIQRAAILMEAGKFASQNETDVIPYYEDACSVLRNYFSKYEKASAVSI